ncbi:MAG TPA: RIP metalloprotease RseP, partial [Gemmatimonadaceae bacterium]
IMIAGVTMNIILAIVIISIMAMHAGRDVLPVTTVGVVKATPTLPALAQLQTGDTITAVNGKPVSTWNEVQQGILTGHGATTIQTKRSTVTIDTKSDSDRIAAFSAIGVYVTTYIDSIVAGDRAAKAGLQRGDSVIAIDGQPVRLWSDLTDKVGGSIEKPLAFDVIRKGAPVHLTITPRAGTNTNRRSTADSLVGKIGAGARDLSRHESIGLGRAIYVGSIETWNMASSVGGFLKALVVGRVSLKQLGGPIAIGRASVNAARSGWEDLFYLIALLSVNVAVLNMLPIPILDGGQILINVIESAKGSPFSLRTREYILRFGLAAIALLFIVVMFNDTRGGFSRLFSWMFK